MNKKVVSTVFFALVTLTMAAQGRLIRIDSEDERWWKSSRQMTFARNELTQLLIPKDVEFGVVCQPSFSPEWALSYDSTAHALFYRKADKSIWHTTYKAMHKLKKKGNKHSKWVPRKYPKDYVAPNVQAYSLAITDEQLQMLKAIWTNAVGNAEKKMDATLDGTSWEYFIDEQRAKARREDNTLVKFTNELADAVRTGDASRKDTLIDNAFQRGMVNGK